MVTLAWPASCWTAGDVGAGVEQLADERAAQVVRREVVDAGALTEEPQAVHDCLGGHAPLLELAALGDRAEQGAVPCAAYRDPGVDGGAATVGGVDDALFAALPGADLDRAVFVVGKHQCHGLATAQPTAVQQREQRGVTGTDEGGATDLEQAADLAHADVATGRQRARRHALDVDDALLGLGVDQAEAPRVSDHATDGRQHVIDRGRLGIALDQDGAQRHHVLVADLGPVDRERIGGEFTSKDLGGALQGAPQPAAAHGGRLAVQVDGSGVLIQPRRRGDDGHGLRGAGMIRCRQCQHGGRRRQGQRRGR